MSVYRLTIFHGRAALGGSETYWTPDATPDNAADLISGLLLVRAQILQSPCYFQGVRISLEGDKRRSVLLIPPGGKFPGLEKFVTVPATGFSSDAPGGPVDNMYRTALQHRITYDTTRATNRYLAGIPRSVVSGDPATFNGGGDPAWSRALKNWEATLVSQGWQIKARKGLPDNPPLQVIGLVAQQAAPGLIGVQVSTTTVAGLAKGQKISLQGMRPAKGVRAATMNGTWYIDSVDQTGLPLYITVYLRGSAGIDPAAQRFTDRTFLQRVTYGFFPIQSLFVQRVGIHKRGRPSTAPRGRRLTRPSLDP